MVDVPSIHLSLGNEFAWFQIAAYCCINRQTWQMNIYTTNPELQAYPSPWAAHFLAKGIGCLPCLHNGRLESGIYRFFSDRKRKLVKSHHAHVRNSTWQSGFTKTAAINSYCWLGSFKQDPCDSSFLITAPWGPWNAMSAPWLATLEAYEKPM